MSCPRRLCCLLLCLGATTEAAPRLALDPGGFTLDLSHVGATPTAGANLLVFIAFNFTIAGDLPRLGYLTFMDLSLISTFLITAVVLVICVYLRRLHTLGREALVNKIDKYLIALYPVAYALVLGGSALLLF